MSADLDPFVAALPAEVPLKDAPLVRVIAQIRFPEILSIEQRDFVAPFQEAIRGTYSVLRQEQAQGMLLGSVAKFKTSRAESAVVNLFKSPRNRTAVLDVIVQRPSIDLCGSCASVQSQPA